MAEINERLKEVLINELKLTAYSIGKGLDVSATTVENWIKGKKVGDGRQLLTPKAKHINKICELYGVNQYWLMTGEGFKYKTKDVEPLKAEEPPSPYGLSNEHLKEKIKMLEERLKDKEELIQLLKKQIKNETGN